VPNLGVLFSDLSGSRRHSGSTDVHVDPVPDPVINAAGSHIRSAGFGQDGAAAGHLDNQGIVAEDLFLFFGLFRNVERFRGKWHYVPNAPAVHLIWGWLHIGSKAAFPMAVAPAGLAHHPHVLHAYPHKNRLYLPSRGFSVGGKHFSPSGAFGSFHINRQLTQNTPTSGCSDWELPAWVVFGGKLALSYHRTRPFIVNPSTGKVNFRSVGRGQEFVFDRALNPSGVDAFLNKVLA
jgi:hypothetical protein